jgi:hypothetical protein
MTVAPIIVAVPMPPVGAYGCAGGSTDGCTAAAAYGASDDCTAHSSLRERVCQGHCRRP